MPLSQDMTAARFWQEVVRDTGTDVLVPLNFERFSIINRAVDDVAGVIFELYFDSYLKGGTLTLTGDSASLTGLRVRRESVARISVSSSVLTKPCTAVSISSYIGFRAGAAQNRNEITFTIQGDNVLFTKGASLSSYGTVTIYYPALPTEVAADSDKVDLPDGTPIAIAILRAKKILADRYQRPQVDYSEQYSTLLQNLYNAFNINLSKEEISEKVRAID
jgi:hypothetical protein